MSKQEHMDVDEFRRAQGLPVRHAAPKRTQPTPGRDSSKYGKRHKAGVMNGTESAYAEILKIRQLAGEVLDWWFEAVTFKIADDCRYTPDFKVLLADRSIEFVDTKGGGPIDPKSLVKIKCAAEKFHTFKFVIEQKQSKKNGGNWTRKEY